MRRRLPVVLLVLLWASTLSVRSQPTPFKSFVARPENQLRWLKEYAGLLSIPNVLGDSVNMSRNANRLIEMLRQRGVNCRLLQSGKSRSAPVVYGEVLVPGATRTIALYAHYDGQPVNPKQWSPGLSPFEPVLYSDRLDLGGKPVKFPGSGDAIDGNWRLYARSASDDKAGVFAIIAGYETMIAARKKPSVNIKFFFEGEEEAGSVHLNTIFEQNKEILKADLWVICDGPRHVSGRKQVLFGVRGDVNIDLTVYAAKRPLHSGNYGNWAPNPAMRLVQLLASMKDGDGMVTIPGFYDDVIPLTDEEKKAIAQIPPVEEMLQKDLALSQPDGAGKSLMELMALPTLNINGIQAANIGSMAANIIPTEATAVLDLRLVLGNDVDRQIGKVVHFIESRGYHVIDHVPSDEERMAYPLLAKVTKRGAGYNAQRTPMSLPLAQNVVKAVQGTTNDPVIIVPSLGGSLPLYLFEKTLDTKPITVPVVNYDNNQHGEDENVKLQYLWDGIETMAAIMAIK